MVKPKLVKEGAEALARRPAKVVDDAMPEYFNRLNSDITKRYQFATEPAIDGGYAQQAGGSIYPGDLLTDEAKSQMTEGFHTLEDFVQFDYAEWQLGYEMGELDEYITLSGKVGDDGVLTLDELTPEQARQLSYYYKEAPEDQINVALDIGERVGPQTKLPRYYRMAGEASGSRRDMFNINGWDNNPRYDAILDTPENNPAQLYKYSTPEEFIENGGIERIFDPVFMHFNEAARQRPRLAVETAVGRLNINKMFDEDFVEASDSFNAMSQTARNNALNFQQQALEQWKFDNQNLWESGLIADEVKRLAKEAKSLYTNKLLGAEGDLADAPLIFHHNGTDWIDEGLYPFSLRRGKEGGMHGGPMAQAHLFDQGIYNPLHAEDRLQFEKLWKELDAQVDDPAELREAIGNAFRKHSSIVSEGNRHDFVLNEDVQVAFKEILEEFVDQDWAVNSSEMLEELAWMHEGDFYEGLADALYQMGKSSSAQVRTAFVVTGQRPLYLRNIVDFHPNQVAEQLRVMPQFTKDRYAKDLDFIERWGSSEMIEHPMFEDARLKMLNIIEDAGYDHIIYNNNYDNSVGGSAPSVILWREDTMLPLQHAERGVSLREMGRLFSAGIPPVAVGIGSLTPSEEAVAGSPKTLHGAEAIAKVREEEGNLTPAMERVIELEGYVDGEYKDTKGITTRGVGQTGRFLNKTFKESFEHHVDRVRDRIPNYDSYPDEVKAELIQAEYRGDLGLSPKAVRLLNAGEYRKAAREFLDNDEYRSKETPAQIKKRMKAVADAIDSLQGDEE